MKAFDWFVKGTVLLLLAFPIFTAQAKVDAGKGCLGCHNGIEDIRAPDSGMMAVIKAMGASHGDPEGCVVCGV